MNVLGPAVLSLLLVPRPLAVVPVDKVGAEFGVQGGVKHLGQGGAEAWGVGGGGRGRGKGQTA